MSKHPYYLYIITVIILSWIVFHIYYPTPSVWPSVLSHLGILLTMSCQTMHEGALQGMWTVWSQWVTCVCCQAVANDRLSLCCELHSFVSLNEDTTMLCVSLWNVMKVAKIAKCIILTIPTELHTPPVAT